MISIQTIKEQYIDKILNQVQGYKFKVFTDAGQYQKSIRKKNTVTNYVNGLMAITGTDTETLAGGEIAVAIDCAIEFVFPVNELEQAHIEQGEEKQSEIQAFREALSQAFSKTNVVSFNVDGNNYTGGVSYQFPVGGMLAIRQGVGLSYTYSCSVQIAYIKNGINSTNIELAIDNHAVPFMTLQLSRNASYIADAHKTSTEAKGYAESTSFSISMTIPALRGVAIPVSIGKFLLGLEPANTPHDVVLEIEGIGAKQQQMIFSSCDASAEGVSNIAFNVTLVPYAGEDTTGG